MSDVDQRLERFKKGTQGLRPPAPLLGSIAKSIEAAAVLPVAAAGLSVGLVALAVALLVGGGAVVVWKVAPGTQTHSDIVPATPWSAPKSIGGWAPLPSRLGLRDAGVPSAAEESPRTMNEADGAEATSSPEGSAESEKLPNFAVLLEGAPGPTPADGFVDDCDRVAPTKVRIAGPPEIGFQQAGGTTGYILKERLSEYGRSRQLSASCARQVTVFGQLVGDHGRLLNQRRGDRLDFLVADNWFVATAESERETLWLEFERAEPLRLSLAGLPPGEHFVGKIPLAAPHPRSAKRFLSAILNAESRDFSGSRITIFALGCSGFRSRLPEPVQQQDLSPLSGGRRELVHLGEVPSGWLQIVQQAKGKATLRRAVAAGQVGRLTIEELDPERPLVAHFLRDRGPLLAAAKEQVAVVHMDQPWIIEGNDVLEVEQLQGRYRFLKTDGVQFKPLGTVTLSSASTNIDTSGMAQLEGPLLVGTTYLMKLQSGLMLVRFERQ